MKRVLVGCEYSGVIRDCFSKMGWDAWSCDLLPTESEMTKAEGKHFQCDIFEVLYQDWDLFIAHPPCTFLSYAGMRNWYDDGRAIKRIDAAKLFMQMYEAPVKHICIENPQGIMGKIFREPDMVIHPYYFGEMQMKRTCLWLKNLPLLTYQLEDDLFSKRTATDRPNPVQIQIRKKTGRIKNRYWTDCIGVGNKIKTGKEKSKTFNSIGRAMAEQWTEYINKLNG
jgi:site-specific DNA-cytosine methylase